MADQRHGRGGFARGLSGFARGLSGFARGFGAVAAALVLVLTGCADDRGPNPGTDGTTMSEAELRTDREPIEKRFPGLGSFEQVHWVGWALSDPSAIGPTDVAIQALVVLAPEDRQSFEAGYSWTPAPADFDGQMRDVLRPYLPDGGDWRHSSEFESFIATASYVGAVYLDFASGTVYLSVNSH